MNKRLVVLGYWGNIYTTQALNSVRRALEIYPFGNDIDKIVYTFPIGDGVHPNNSNPMKRISPTLIMCEGEGSIEDLLPKAFVLASGIDRIINWCNIHSLEDRINDKDRMVF